MRQKRIGTWLIILSVVLMTLMVLLESSSLASFRDNASAIASSLTLSSIACLGFGITLYFLNVEEKKRRKAIIIITITCSLLLSLAIYAKRHSFAGASISFVASLFFFSFSGLPLIIKARYEKRKHLFTQKQIALSFLDLFSFMGIILAILFKLMHWPGAVYMLTGGIIGFLISTFSWHRFFDNEVRLRVKAEKDLKHAFNELEEKNNEITDSITYAKRIQTALLASENLLRENLNDFFVLFQPKDIVSGDFYWATNEIVSVESGNNFPNSESRFYLAVADSTGHGVPGAFMSLLNIAFLNEAISEKKITEPNNVLNYVRQKLINAISREGQKDGFDGILICLDRKNNKLTYAAANNAPILIRDEKIIELECDRMPVGQGEKDASFTLFSLDLKPNDQLYLYTDGYADQFGGPKGKKFKYKQLNELISLASAEPQLQQFEILKNKLKEWKGSLEQVDDILIVGIKH